MRTFSLRKLFEAKNDFAAFALLFKNSKFQKKLCETISTFVCGTCSREEKSETQRENVQFKIRCGSVECQVKSNLCSACTVLCSVLKWIKREKQSKVRKGRVFILCMRGYYSSLMKQISIHIYVCPIIIPTRITIINEWSS